MTTNPRHHRLLALAAAGALVLASCSSGGDDKADETTTTTARSTTTEKATTTTEATTTTTTDDEIDTLAELEAAAQGALITAADLGNDFEEEDYEQDNSTGPCTDAHPDDLIEPAVHVGSAAGRRDAGFEQTIRIYDDEAEGKDAFANFEESISCDGGTITQEDGTTSEVGLLDELDIASINDEIDDGYGREVSTEGAQGYVVAARYGASVITFQFFSTLDADESTLPDPQEVISDAIDKVAAA